MRKLTKEEFELRIAKVHPKENLKVLVYDGDKKDCIVKCRNCETIYTKKAGCFVDKRKVSICKICFPTKQTGQKKSFFIPPEGYQLMEPYNGMHTNILVKHLDCGFIWKVKPNNLKYGKGCPRCNRKVPKGEQKIIKWLQDNNIDFKIQIPINLNGHHLSVDFYLPQYDLYIEYNGIQHYEPVKHFGGEEKFKKQQEYDQLKINHFKDKLLIIPYTEFDNIEKILKSSTTK